MSSETSENCFENFRLAFTLNLSHEFSDPELIIKILNIVDLSMQDYDIIHKPLDIIPVSGFPEVAKCFLASKAISNLSKSTLKQYRYKLINFFNAVQKSYADIKTNDIRLYLYNFKTSRNASDCYMDNVRITLNTFFQWLVDNEYIQRNPCAKIEKIKYQQKRRESFSTLSLEALRIHCVTSREKALVDFLYSTGCRVSECADVLLTDINWEDNSVLIRHGKGNKSRTVYFNDESKVSLKAYISTREDNNPALWVSVRKPNHQIHAHALEDIIREVGKRAGEHAYPHKLRHTFATVGLRNGMPINQIQALMGHTNPQTTLIYADQDKTQIRMEHVKTFG